eukprot:tig00000882_g5250.t1
MRPAAVARRVPQLPQRHAASLAAAPRSPARALLQGAPCAIGGGLGGAIGARGLARVPGTWLRRIGTSAEGAEHRPVLSAEQTRLLNRTKALVDRLRARLAGIEAEADDVEVLQHVSDGLRDLFLLVVVGEFNTGKSTFMNALLGGRYLKEGVTPTTNSLQVVRYGPLDDQGRVRVEVVPDGREGDEVEHVFLPVEWLRQISVVDTPGTNAVIARHQRLTEHFVPRSDLVLFVTSVERPFSESERAFLQRIREWGKKVIVVVNKLDTLEDEAELDQVLVFVRDHARELLGPDGAEPARIFPVSGRQALKAKLASSEAQRAGGWASPEARAESERKMRASRFASLEAFVLESLTARERFRLKLENPINCALRLIEKYLGELERRRSRLDADRETLLEVRAAVEEHAEDLRRDFRYHMSHVENALTGLTDRADAFYEAHLQLANLPRLLRGERVREAFQREVFGDIEQRIERHVSELAHWLVDKNVRQWHFVSESVERRAGARLGRRARRAPGTLVEDAEHRAAVVESVVGRAALVMRSLDRAAEGQRLVEGTRDALLSALLDAAGLLTGAALAGGSLYVLPRRRAALRDEARRRAAALRARLDAALRETLEGPPARPARLPGPRAPEPPAGELEASARRVEEQVRPYAEAVAAEEARVAALARELEEEREQLRALAAEVAREAGEAR